MDRSCGPACTPSLIGMPVFSFYLLLAVGTGALSLPPRNSLPHRMVFDDVKPPLAARTSGDRAVIDLDRELADRACLDLVDGWTSLLGTEVEEIWWIRSGLGELLGFRLKLNVD